MPSVVSQVAGKMNSETYNVSHLRQVKLRLDGLA